jgi:23S rRNA (guanosine2251-2'-O)-methyltransferase
VLFSENGRLMSMAYYIHGFHVLKVALSNVPKQIIKLYLLESRSDARAEEIIELAKRHHIPIEWLPRDMLDKKSPNTIHQGMIAACDKPRAYDEDFLKKICKTPDKNSPLLLLVLDEVQDPHNLGACLRTANAFDVNAVIVPKNRSVQLTTIVGKVSSGALFITPVVAVKNLARTLDWIKTQNIWVVGTDLRADAPLTEVDLKGNTALVLGNEANGLRELTRKKCDFLISIPMQGEVESLNVSVATGICLYEVARQRFSSSYQ